MRRDLLYYAFASAVVIVTVYQLLRTGEITARSFPVIGMAALICVNGLIFLVVRRRKVNRKPDREA